MLGNKLKALMLPYAMLMASNPMSMGYDDSVCISRQNRNSDKKCLTKGCTNKRDGNHLYCSLECRKLHLAGKVKHQPAIFPQLSSEKIQKDLQNIDYKQNPKRLTPDKLFKEKFGYEIIYWKNGVIIHN